MIGGPKQVNGAVVMSEVDPPSMPGFARGLCIFLLAERVSEEPIRVRVPRTADREALVKKVNSLVGKTVDVLYYRQPWQIKDKSGIVNYLQSIEER